MQQTSNTEAYIPTVTYRNLEGDVLSRPKPIFQSRPGHEQPGEDDFVYLNARKRRRLAKAARSREMKKHQRAFVRRELGKEREANQLAQLFNLHDGLVKSSPMMRFRATQAIVSRVRFIRDRDQARYDRQWEERKKNRNLPAPPPVIGHDDVMAQLRAVAKTASTVVPKAPRKTEAEIEDLAATNYRSQLAIGRTGRAG